MRSIRNSRPRSLFIFDLALALLLMGAAFVGAQSRTINVVAAENFYGDIAAQIGGDRVSVTSIMSDPNIDPHEYESSVDDARALASADVVIENGGGYDDWIDKLLSASPRASRQVIKGFDLAGNRLPENEHVWYAVENAATIAEALMQDLSNVLPQSASFFSRNNQVFQRSLEPIKARIAQVASRWSGTPVGLTETIFLYQTGPLGLKVLTPFEFQKAIAEGNDPPADSVVETENQIKQKKIRILIYNEQTVSAITTKALDDARAAGIPVVGVTETMPPGETYQTWMLRQLDEVRMALLGAGS